MYCFRDTLIVVVADAVTSIVAGCAVFSILGHLAHIMSVTVDKVVQSGEKFINNGGYVA